MPENDIEELDYLRTVVRDFFASRSGFDAIRSESKEARPFDQALWLSVARELGLAPMLVPEDYGGGGGSFAEAAVVLEESGRALVGDPLLASAVLAVAALKYSGDTAAMNDLLPRLAEGTATASVAFGSATVQAQEQPGGWILDGTVAAVVNGADVDILLVIADRGVFAVERTSVGLDTVREAVLDQTRSLATVSLIRTPGRLVGEVGSSGNQIMYIAEIALAAEQIGGATAALDMAVGYAKTREAFGRPIGSFQAIKHKLAEVFFAVEAARGALDLATRAIARGEDLGFPAAAARIAATEAFVLAASENIQVHGAIGFTWEYPAHFYLKRAYSSKALLTPTGDLLARVATQLEKRVARA